MKSIGAKQSYLFFRVCSLVWAQDKAQGPEEERRWRSL